MTSYGKATDKIIDLINSGVVVAAEGILETDGAIAARQLNDVITNLFALSVAEAEATSQENARLARLSGWISMVLTTINVIGAIALGFLLTFITSAEAARNTSDLIEKTIRAVKNGNNMTTSTRKAFGANAELSVEIAQLVDEIATASQEQATGIEQLNRAVAEMDTVTQQTAVNAGQSASTAEGMSTQANRMRGYIEDLAAVIGGSRRHTLGVASPSA